MSTLAPEKTLEELAEAVKTAKKDVEIAKVCFHAGKASYDELAGAGKALSNAMFEYSKKKFPSVKARKLPYQALIR